MSSHNWVYFANTDFIAGKAGGPPMLAFNLNSVGWSVKSPDFSQDDFTGDSRLRLVKRWIIGTDDLDRYLWKQVQAALSESDLQLLSRADDNAVALLLKALNSDKILGYSGLYQQGREFEPLKLAGKLRKGPEANDEVSTKVRNRFLLEDAYPEEIRKMPRLSAEEGKPMFPWGLPGDEQPVVSADFLLYTHSADVPDQNWAGPTALHPDAGSLTAPNVGLENCLQKAYQDLIKFAAPEFDHKRDGSTILTYVDHSPDAVLPIALENTWSSVLAGASMQGYPIAHSLRMAFWLTSEALPSGKWMLAVPKALNGLKIRLPIEPAKEALSDLDIWPVNVTYAATDQTLPDIVLRVNARASAVPAPAKPFIGQNQQIHAATFTNWMGMLPYKLGEYLDLVWLCKTMPISAQQIDDFFTEAFVSALERMRMYELAMPLGASAVGASAAFASMQDKLGGFQQKWVEPSFLLFLDHADLGLRPPFQIMRGEPNALSHTLACELIGQAVLRAPKTEGRADEDFEVLWRGLADHLVTNPKIAYPFESKAKPRGSQVMNWTREILLPALRQVDGDESGRSHSGHYQELFEIAQFQTGDMFAPFKDLKNDDWETDDKSALVKRLSDTFARKLTAAQEQLSLLTEDEEALLRIFCLHWDAVLNQLRNGDKRSKALYFRVIAHLGHTDSTKGEPQIIMNASPREWIREYLQQANVRLSARYADGLTGDVLPDLAGLLDSEVGPIVQGLARSFFDPKLAAKTLKAPTFELPPKLSQEQWTKVWESSREAFPKDLSPFDEWSKVFNDENEDMANYAAFLIRCFILLSRPTLVDEILDGALSSEKTTSPNGKSTPTADKKDAIRSQMFLGAAYLGRGLFSYIKQRCNGWPTLREGEPEIPGTVPYFPIEGELILAGNDAFCCEMLARVLCGPGPSWEHSDGGELPSVSKNHDSLDLHWKNHPWTQALIGLDRIRSFVPTPPSLPIPLLTNRRMYHPARYSGVLILARRVDPKSEAESSWWLINVGEPIIETNQAPWPHQEPLKVASVDSKESGEISDALTDEVNMNWFDQYPDRFIRVGIDTRVVPAPWQVAASFGITQSVVEFRGKPLGVRLWDDAEDDSLSNKEVTGLDRPAAANPELDLLRYQIISTDKAYKGWGPVPGLRYDKELKYQFLFVPIHNTGALPWELRGGSPGAVWTRLPDAKQPFVGGRGLPILDDDAVTNNLRIELNEHAITVTDYVRRVPIGQVRLARPFLDAGETGDPNPFANKLEKLVEEKSKRRTELEPLIKSWRKRPNMPPTASAEERLIAGAEDRRIENILRDFAFRDYVAPVIPGGVRPLYVDLQDQATYNYLQKLRPLHEREDDSAGSAPPSLPAQTILLRKSKGHILEPESVATFVIRPPATSIENWTIWQSSQIDASIEENDDEGREDVLDCIADVNRLVRELSASPTPDANKPRGLELTQLLDDPAVEGVFSQGANGFGSQRKWAASRAEATGTLL